MLTDALTIAIEYNKLPIFNPKAVSAWLELADITMKQYESIKKSLFIKSVEDENPYANSNEMFEDIKQGKFKVSHANSEHPIWTVEQNIAFRTVHDVWGHFETQGDFSWEGELLACGLHFSRISNLAKKALFVECMGQTSFAVVNGFFTIQKVGFII